MQSANRLVQTAIEPRSEVRESCSASVTSYDVAKHYRDMKVVPIRKTISDELLLRYNGMDGHVHRKTDSGLKPRSSGPLQGG